MDKNMKAAIKEAEAGLNEGGIPTLERGYRDINQEKGGRYEEEQSYRSVTTDFGDFHNHRYAY